MKALQQFCVASVLTLTLSLSAFAGDMTTGAPSPQPTPSVQGDPHTDVAGDMNTTNADESGDSVADAALALIQGVLSLF